MVAMALCRSIVITESHQIELVFTRSAGVQQGFQGIKRNLFQKDNSISRITTTTTKANCYFCSIAYAQVAQDDSDLNG